MLLPKSKRKLKNNKFLPARLRATILKMAFAGSTVHIACAFSLVEILSVLYRSFLRFPDSDPESIGRDFLVLSKGHGVMAQYACLHEMGWLDDASIEQYCRDGTELKGLSDSRVKGLEVTSGSLGHGLPIAVGIAKAAKLKKTNQRVFVILGDGELNEGTNWEAMLFASHHRLDNLLVVIDCNGLQAMGRTHEILGLGDLSKKFESFGFAAIEVNGHDENEIEEAIESCLSGANAKPTAIVANTVKGKGVSFMEDDNRWHYTRLSQETYDRALGELMSGDEK